MLNEISGLVYVGEMDAYLAINDSGNEGQMWRYDPLTKDVLGFGESRPNRDWEALSYDAERQEIVVCDVGDNARSSSLLTAYRYKLNGQVIGEHQLIYPDGAYDCEACLWKNNQLTLITKAKVLKGGKWRQARVYTGTLAQDTVVLSLVDSFTLKRRSVTDAHWLGKDSMLVLAYNYGLFGPFPFSKTTIYRGSLLALRQNRTRTRRLSAPFTLTQYESIATEPNGQLLLASERTVFWPARWRRLKFR